MEYISGSLSIRELAKRKRISYSTMSKKASEGGWSAKRKKFRQEVESEALAQAHQRGVERLDQLMKGAEQLLDAAMGALNDELQFQRYVTSEGSGEGVSETVEKTFEKRDTRAMKDMAAVIRELSGLLRDTYGIYTPAQEMNQQLVKEKIRREKQATKNLERAMAEQSGGREVVVKIGEEALSE